LKNFNVPERQTNIHSYRLAGSVGDPWV